MITHNGVLDKNSSSEKSDGNIYYSENIWVPKAKYVLGDTVEIELSSDDFDPSLFASDADCNEHEDTGKRSVLPARITFTVADDSEAHDYLLSVTTTSPEKVGNYKLTYRKV